jgi:NAD(P)-dependent dehydrogenase (short-subunit alcohol dehydrogenase family)
LKQLGKHIEDGLAILILPSRRCDTGAQKGIALTQRLGCNAARLVQRLAGRPAKNNEKGRKTMKFAGKVVVITGGANGIGAALCRRFVDEKPEAIVAVDLEEDNAKKVAEEVGGSAYGCDVADEAQVKAVMADIEKKFGRIDLLFSNAGIGVFEGPEGFLGEGCNNEAWERSWKINVMGHVYGARAVLPGMLERGEGYIASTSSAAGLLNQIGSTTYGTTKHAAVGLAENLSIMYGDRGVRFSVLCPQAVQTRMIGDTDGSVAGVDGVLSAEAVADCCIDAMDKETFLILPHEEVLVYMQRKTSDYDRWLAGMRRLKGHFV